MKLGIRIPLVVDPNAPDRYHQVHSLCELAEQAGFDFVSLTHHSFTEECETSAPFVFLAAIAARTKKIRLSTIVFVLPLHHPVAVAEQVAMLDRVSNGRAVMGVGIGYRDYEFKGFGVSPRDRGARADEALTAIRSAWRTGTYGFEGKHFRIPELPVIPMPVQKPHPPIWVGGLSDPALRRAARLGDGWISDNMMAVDDVAALANRYREQCAAAGTRPYVVVTRNGWVSETREQAALEWYDSVKEFHLGYRRAGYIVPDPEGIYDRLERGEDVEIQDYCRDRAIGGSPGDCIEQLSGWRTKVGCDAMLLILNDDAGYESLARTIRLFGEKVIPHVP